MKQKTYLFFIIILVVGLPTSCINDDDISKNPPIIEPEYLPMFQYDNDGVPFRYQTPILSKEIQSNVKKNFVGYGWRWMQTSIIEESGYVRSEEFFDSKSGMSPFSFFVSNDSSLVKFFHSNEAEKYYLNRIFSLDNEKGVLTDGTKPFGGDAWSLYMKIWSVYELHGKWYMSCIQPLYMKYNEVGVGKVVWGTSQYVRMTDSELQEFKSQYTTDYNQAVNK